MKVQGSPFFFGNQADPQAASFDHFFNWLQSLPPGSTWPPHVTHSAAFAYRREFFCNTLSDMYCGVILSARSTDFNHYINRTGNTVRVESRPVGANPPVEVNFFCLRKDSSKGLYSHYYGSYAFSSFLKDLWGGYRTFVEMKRDEALGVLTDPDDKSDVHDKYTLRNRAKYAPLYNPEDFDRLVRELTEVFEVRLTSYQVTAPEDTPVSNRISNVHQVYRLTDHQHVDQPFLSWLRKKRDDASRILRSGRRSRSGSVLGIGPDGRERTIFFEDTLDDLLNFNYDDIGSFDVLNISANPCLAQMIATVRSSVMFRP
jgi:hypothetical protein